MPDKFAISRTEIKTRLQRNREKGISNDELIIDMLLEFQQELINLNYNFYVLNKRLDNLDRINN